AALAFAVLLALGGRDPALRPSEARAVAIVPLTADCGGAAPASGARPRLVVAGVWAGAEARRFAAVLARFARRTGVEVTYAYETRNIAAKLEGRIERGCPPDVALLPQPGLLARLAREGRIQPLDPATAATVRRHYGRTWRQLATVRGRAYGVWFKAAGKSSIWYRPGALRTAGVDRPPRSWPELLETARRLAAAGVRPFAVAGASPWTLTDWFENLYLRSAGPVPYQRLAEHRIRWTDPSVVRVLRQLAGLLSDRALVGLPGQALETSFEESVDQVFGDRPEAAMVYEGDFVRSFLPPGAAHAAGAEARFFAFPGAVASGPPVAVVGGDVAVRLQACRDALTRRAAAALAGADTVRFDLSDLQPPAFGATAEQGMWEIFQDFLADPSNPEATARRLEAAARAAWACERAIAGRC
ncbi:MAG: carbohydrate ABC transporter substrate-binding protein, partial [Solirubrobacterales bacterium]|nr:carbohydrate ABC transporter substrate-binding protein [Solirubrobacterales bacterium]